jgi:hypothetical protein
LKHALQVLDHSGVPPSVGPLLVRFGDRLVSVVDTGDGLASGRFVDALLAAGAERVDSPGEASRHTRIVIRGTPKSREARLRAEALEEAADLILGSMRPGFARYFGSACARGVNS